MVGLSMALTIAVCIGSFVWIYGQIEPFTKDFVDAATAGPTTVSQSQEEDTAESEATEPADEEATVTSETEAVPTDESNVDDSTDAKPTPTSTPDEDEFKPTHTVSSEVTINFRPGPGVNTGEPISTLAPGTELQYLGETEQSQDPGADGDTAWMQFRTEDGEEGWIRQIDVTAINAGQ
jgi:hypothetical protein